MRLFVAFFSLLTLTACSKHSPKDLHAAAISRTACPFLVPVSEVSFDPILFYSSVPVVRKETAFSTQLTLVLLAKKLRDNPEWQVTIVGQTRKEGNYQANEFLAHERADLVAEKLEAAGVWRSRMLVLAYPESGKGANSQSVVLQICASPKR